MNMEKSAEDQLLGLIENEVAKIIRDRRGIGASINDPIRLGPMYSLLAPMTEKFCVSSIYGKENRDWFDAGRKYYKNETICEQRVRLAAERKPKQEWAQPGHTYGMFFDISELTHEAPIPNAVKQLLMKGGLQIPLPNTTLVSRFPLIEVRAKSAVEAARIIGGHLRAAEAQGWKLGCAEALVNKWRNEYELTKGNEKTVMQFDMRPCLLSDSLPNLIALTMLAAQPKLEEALQEFERSKSLPVACASAGVKLAEASSEQMEQIRRPSRSSQSPALTPDIAFDRRERSIDWNRDALEKRVKQKVLLVSDRSTTEMCASDLMTFLVLAKSSTWEGGADLFQNSPYGFYFTLRDGQTIRQSDAATLSKSLHALSQKLPESDPALRDLRLFAAIAGAGAFSIKFETPPSEPPPIAANPAHVLREAATDVVPGVAGPPGGVARFRGNLRPFNPRDRIIMLNGFYACTSARVRLLPSRDYLNTALREGVSAPPDTLGIVTDSNQLLLNADQVHVARELPYAYMRTAKVTMLYGPTFADAICYGFYRLVCNFVGKDEFPTEGDVIQHARNLKRWDLEQWRKNPAGERPVHERVKLTLHFMREFGERTPLENIVAKAQSKVRWRFFD
jgi:hypothetical protein